jgi:hypothetical protein
MKLTPLIVKFPDVRSKPRFKFNLKTFGSSRLAPPGAAGFEKGYSGNVIK